MDPSFGMQSALPPAGEVAVVPGGSSGSFITGGGDPNVVVTTETSTEAQIQGLYTTIIATIGALTAQLGGTGVVGGGGASVTGAITGAAGMVVDADSLRAAAGGGAFGGTGGWSSNFSIQAEAVSVTGGGAGAGSSGLVGPTTVGGGGISTGWTIVNDVGTPVSSTLTPMAQPAVATQPVGAAAAPAAPVAPSASPAPVAPTAPVTGGGAPVSPATPQIDYRRVLGTPQAGGLIATVLAAANPDAPPAKSEGSFMVLTDAAGAQLQAHVHGPWQYHPDRIQEAVQRGFLAVHVHPDGTLHLHDVV